jgi:hypothetical protein
LGVSTSVAASMREKRVWYWGNRCTVWPGIGGSLGMIAVLAVGASLRPSRLC